MNKIESFANLAASPRPPLELGSAAVPVSCFWAAFNGAAVGALAVAVVDQVAAHYIGGHGHFSADSEPVAGGPLQGNLSADQLVGLCGALRG